MGAADLDLLPVVSRADINKLEGVITLQELLNSFGVSSIAQRSGMAKAVKIE